ncbi:MAG: phosphate regulon transcriptional regulator PhoB [Alphaproteobacteria bacterium]|nr:phosphate regulon transcriptional regulator PhoB [Alphaproteobacteria bacterium]
MATIMIVEDEQAISLLLKYNLEKEGYETICIAHGNRVISAVEKSNPSLILLDWMLPEMSGLELCRIIRNNPEYKNIPIIMLTAKGQEEDKVRGLSAGADDYVTKPFSVPELLARIKTNLRRVTVVASTQKKEYVFQDIRLDTVQKKIFRGENYVRVGPTEFRILQLLLTNPRQVFSREDLLKEVWGNSVYVELRTVDVHIRRLRKALNEFGPDYIRTIRATGYSIDDHEVEE